MKKVLISAVALASMASSATATTYFKETFDDKAWTSRWVDSDWKKSDGAHGEFKLSSGDWHGSSATAQGLQTSQDARFYAASAKFPKSFSNEGKDLVVQFSVKHTQKIDCGGGYLKLMPGDVDQAHFGGDSKYNLMVGPDVCGTSTKKTHFIFAHEGENLLIKKDIKAETDQMTHIYTFIVHPDDSYEVLIDGKEVQKGNLLEDWAFSQPKTIKDPSASKPSDWVDESQMDDPEDKKPADFDAIPAQIADPEAKKPDDWDEEADGEWEAPTIANPAYKGAWRAKKIPNPAYKGPWVHPEVPNPKYEEKTGVYKYSDIGAIGIDIWQVKSGTIFDSIIVTDSLAEAEAFGEAQFSADDRKAEKDAFDAAEKAKNEVADAERKRVEEERKKQEAKKAEDGGEEEDEEEEDDHAGHNHEDL